MNIVIFGGTFNPFHIGHEKMLETICNMELADKVFVIPDHIPPHKETDFLATDRDRLNMCKLVCRKYKCAEVSAIEIERKGKSYTIDTISELKKTYKNDKFYFVCGGDMISILDKWYNFDKLKNETEFLAFSRNDDEKFSADTEKMRKLGAKITVIDVKIPDVSSTDFRKNGLKELLPDEIYDYIKEKGLYNE